MADEHPEVVGSAITRILVPQNVSSVLSVTAVPAEALSYNGSLRDSVSIVTGCAPVDVIDAREYRRVLDKLRSDDFWKQLGAVMNFNGRFSFELWYDNWRFFESTLNGMGEFTDSDLAKHSLTAELSPFSIGSPLFAAPYLFSGMPDRGKLREIFDSELSLDTFVSSTRILSSFLTASDRASAALRGIYSYDIPFGNSPSTSKEQLETLIKSAKQIVVAPLYGSMAAASGAIAAGHFVVALDCALTGGAVTLIFIGTIAVAEFVTKRLGVQRTGAKA
jgi:hypothetical protein